MCLCIIQFLFFAVTKLCNLHGRDILSLSGVLGKITIKEYTYIYKKKRKKKDHIINHLF